MLYIYEINIYIYIYEYICIYIYIYGSSHFKSKPKKCHSGPFPFSGLPAQAFDPPPLAQGWPRKLLKKS